MPDIALTLYVGSYAIHPCFHRCQTMADVVAD